VEELFYLNRAFYYHVSNKKCIFAKVYHTFSNK
jgi:hypothetical protein